MHSAGEETYQETRQVEQGNFATAGQISASFKNTLKKLGVASPVIRIAIASYEAEINLAIHSWGGTMRLVIYPNRVRLLVDDVVSGHCGYRPGHAGRLFHRFRGSTDAGLWRRHGHAQYEALRRWVPVASQVGKGTSICMEFNL